MSGHCPVIVQVIVLFRQCLCQLSYKSVLVPYVCWRPGAVKYCPVYRCPGAQLVAGTSVTTLYETRLCETRKTTEKKNHALHPKNYEHNSCFVVFCLWWISPMFFRVTLQALGQSYDYWGNHMIAPMPVKWPWRIRVYGSHEFITN